jgi:hypothetical protein
MRQRFAGHAAVFAMALVLSLCPHAWAQQRTRRAAGEQLRNQPAGAFQKNLGAQTRTSGSARNETIRGVIAGITAEGEVILDYRTNAAARTEGAFLTIVGSPVKSEAAEGSRPATASVSPRSSKGRHNVYVAWLSPRTTISEEPMESGGFGQNRRREEGRTESRENKPMTFDQLELGDHVEIQFSPQEESGATNNVHQNQRMRQKHGRDRTFVGYATAITVRHPESREHKSTTTEEKHRETPK